MHDGDLWVVRGWKTQAVTGGDLPARTIRQRHAGRQGSSRARSGRTRAKSLIGFWEHIDDISIRRDRQPAEGLSSRIWPQRRRNRQANRDIAHSALSI